MSELRSSLVALALLIMIGVLGWMLVTRERAAPASGDTGGDAATADPAAGADAPTLADSPPVGDSPPVVGDSSSMRDARPGADSLPGVDAPQREGASSMGETAAGVGAPSGAVLSDAPVPEASPDASPAHITRLAGVAEIDELVLATDRVVWRDGRTIYEVARDGTGEVRTLVEVPFEVRSIASPVPDLLFVAAENTIYRYELGAGGAPPKPLIAPSKPFVVHDFTLFADEENVWFVGTQSPGDTDDEMLAIWRVSASGGRMKTRAVGDKYLREPVDIVFDGEAFYLGRYYANNVRRVPTVDGSPKTLARDVIVGIEYLAVGGGMVFVVDEDELWRVSTPKGGDPVRMFAGDTGPVVSDGRHVYWVDGRRLMGLPVGASEADTPGALRTLPGAPLLLSADGQGLVAQIGAELVAIDPP